jgi:Na+/H+ antiporter NhaD/arsenite permease-like protein/CBS domain-containing protein
MMAKLFTFQFARIVLLLLVSYDYLNAFSLHPHTLLRNPIVSSKISGFVGHRRIGTKATSNESLGQTASSITPEGYGFSTTLRRILDDTGKGFYKAYGSDPVIDVIQGITASGKTNGSTEKMHPDVALVFDDKSDALVGIFTERDYVKLSTRCAQANTEEESAQFLLSPVSKYVTPASKIVALASSSTARVAIAEMEKTGLRHLVVSDRASENNRLLSQSELQGVISMRDVMGVVQKDERISLQTLADKYPLLNNPMSRLREQMKTDANEAAKDPETIKNDIIRASCAVIGSIFVGLFFSDSLWLNQHADIVMIGIFVLGYIGIIFEQVFELNKAAIALLMSTGLWITYGDYYNTANGVASEKVLGQLSEQLAEVSDICFFLLAASAIVEVVDAHQGFKVITSLITTKSKKALFWIIGFFTFFLSSILNNLTVTIVMVSLLRKLIPNEDDRRLFGAMVVVAANAGGVWTPIGDVTTTMLWINGQLTTLPTITQLFLPSISCLIASLAFIAFQVKDDNSLQTSTLPEQSELAPRGSLVFWMGILSLLSVPVFNELTGLPPYLAMLTGLGVIWALTDAIHLGEKNRDLLKMPASLQKLDTGGILFFLGILMSIGVLDKSGLLKQLAVFLNDTLPSQDIIATVIGIASALIDNVPLVAATMGMYDLNEFGADDRLWQLIALCAGTGGSILVIGSASGVALMGLEKVDFLWYFKKVTLGATIGYFAGIAVYLAQSALLQGI